MTARGGAKERQLELFEHYQWAIDHALAELQERGRLSGTLPPAFTSNLLRIIRTSACASKNHAIECAKWTMKPLAGQIGPPPYQVVRRSEEDGQYGVDPYPCEGCQHPKRVQQQLLIEKLFEKSHDLNTWKRYAHQGARMKFDDFRIVVATALCHNWITRDYFGIIMTRINELEIAKWAVRAEVARAKERQSHSKNGPIILDVAGIELELKKQANLFQQRERKRLENRMPHFSPAIRAAFQKLQDAE